MNLSNIHRKAEGKFLIKPKNALTVDGSFCIVDDKRFECVSLAFADYMRFFTESFGISLSSTGEKCFTYEVREKIGNSYGFDVTDNGVAFFGGTPEAVVQAIFYSEDIMYATPQLEKKTYTITPKVFPRIASSCIGINEYTEEYLLIILHSGYNGVLFYDGADFANCAKLAKKYGLLTYLFTDKAEKQRNIDCLILKDNIPCEDDIPHIFLADGATQFDNARGVLIGFDEGQPIERDGAKTVSRNFSLLMGQCSDKFIKAKNSAEASGCKVLALANLSGKSCEFKSVPYIPAMMQWLLRCNSLLEQNVCGTVECNEAGFTPSIVSEFVKTQLLEPREEAGFAIQRLAGIHYGIENTEKLIMVFKKISDGVNYLVFNDADYTYGPLEMGIGFPLAQEMLYTYPFGEIDVTLETDCALNAADNFQKAAMILSHIENCEAKELEYLCRFMTNTLVTVANVKRWYRRVYALNGETVDFKRKFIIEQMTKIAREEIKNAEEAGEMILDCPRLAGDVSAIPYLEGKIKITEAAINKYIKEIEQTERGGK